MKYSKILAVSLGCAMLLGCQAGKQREQILSNQDRTQQELEKARGERAELLGGQEAAAARQAELLRLSQIGVSTTNEILTISKDTNVSTREALAKNAETLDKTTLGAWQPGQKINLEPALRLGDEMGGHIVSGHVDGVAILTSIADEGDSKRLQFEAPDDLKFLIAAKGSITLDGVSLTVNEVKGRSFGINVIAHTQEQTTLGDLKKGDRVNLEIDMLARYVARLQHKE